MFGKKEVIVRISANLTWKVGQDPRTGMYLGVCEPLNLNATGETWDEFTECANEAIGLLFEDLLADSEFEAFLRARGWSHTPLPEPGRTPRFDVPFNVEQNRYADLIPARA